jgi:hypothetical protein
LNGLILLEDESVVCFEHIFPENIFRVFECDCRIFDATFSSQDKNFRFLLEDGSIKAISQIELNQYLHFYDPQYK